MRKDSRFGGFCTDQVEQSRFRFANGHRVSEASRGKNFGGARLKVWFSVAREKVRHDYSDKDDGVSARR